MIMRDFWEYVEIVKTELSHEKELTPEGSKGSEITQKSLSFSRPAPEPLYGCPRAVFFGNLGSKVL